MAKEESKARYLESKEDREARRKVEAKLRQKQEVILNDKTISEREKLQHMLNHQLLIASYKAKLMEERDQLEKEAEEAKRSASSKVIFGTLNMIHLAGVSGRKRELRRSVSVRGGGKQSSKNVLNTCSRLDQRLPHCLERRAPS